MSDEVIDISWSLLVLFCLTLVIPLSISRYFKLNIEREAIVSVGRMSIQLLLVGVYLEYLFDINNPLVNSIWLLIMILVGASLLPRTSWVTWYVVEPNFTTL